MFKRPEELIVLVMGILWVALTYFIAAALTADTATVFTISGFTLLWAAVCFILWQRNLSRLIWPFFLGFLVACWWPYLNWFAASGLPETAAPVDTWYTGWTFKLIIALIPVALAYYFQWRAAKKRRLAEASSF